MRCAILLGCVIVFTASNAGADLITECTNDLRPEVRVRACTQIIEDKTASWHDKVNAYASRGDARTDAGAAAIALADFDEALRRENANVAALRGRARAYLFLGKNLSSIADYTAWIGIAPTADAYVERAHAYTVDQKFDLAVHDSDQALNLNPKNWKALNERGVAYFGQGEYLRALDDFSSAIALWPSAEIFANRGNTNKNLGRDSDAISDYRQALLQNPSLATVRQALKHFGVEDSAITREADTRVREGALLAETKCNACHVIGLTGASTDKDAPSFRSIKDRRPYFWLTAPIAQAVLATHARMPKFDSPQADVDNVIAYINSLQ